MFQVTEIVRFLLERGLQVRFRNLEFKYPSLGSMAESESTLSNNFDDSAAIMARIRLARIALTKLQKAMIFGTRRVALESKKVAYESLVLRLSQPRWFCMARNAGL